MGRSFSYNKLLRIGHLHRAACRLGCETERQPVSTRWKISTATTEAQGSPGDFINRVSWFPCCCRRKRSHIALKHIGGHRLTDLGILSAFFLQRRAQPPLQHTLGRKGDPTDGGLAWTGILHQPLPGNAPLEEQYGTDSVLGRSKNRRRKIVPNCRHDRLATMVAEFIGDDPHGRINRASMPQSFLIGRRRNASGKRETKEGDRNHPRHQPSFIAWSGCWHSKYLVLPL